MAPRENENTEEYGNPYKSSLGMKYPSLRDHFFKTGETWIIAKKIDDGYQDLWRIYDNLYDFSQFIKIHPGGKEWLELTQGTDITEAFEAHHLTKAPENLLQKYYVRQAKTPRDSPFTLKEDGFYKTLKREAMKVLKDVPEYPAKRSKLIVDSLLICYLTLSSLAAIKNNYYLAALAGTFLACLTIAGHNYLHMKNNFRMYYFNLSGMSWRMWRVTHVLSHHIYTNTINDMELTGMEPVLKHRAIPKSLAYKIFSWLASPFFYMTLFIDSFLRALVQRICWNIKIHWDDFIPLSVLLLMYVVSGRDFFTVLKLFVFIILFGSLHFQTVGVNAAHHHPEIFHDGDVPRPKEERDWGVHQIDAVMDRTDITGNPFLVLTNFGDHCLHHLFPTIDHGKLDYLYPVFEETCKKFGVELKMETQLDMIKGQFKRLLMTKPKDRPKPLAIKSL